MRGKLIFKVSFKLTICCNVANNCVLVRECEFEFFQKQ